MSDLQIDKELTDCPPVRFECLSRASLWRELHRLAKRVTLDTASMYTVEAEETVSDLHTCLTCL